jgi:peptide/nickel transport system substrate-binding protein
MSTETPKISRREFFRLTALTAAGVGLAACTTPTPAPTTAPVKTAAPATVAPAATAVPATKAPEPTKAPAATAAPASKYKEAPMLADLVKAGKLPPVDQRLPTEVETIKPLESVGVYGGIARTVCVGENTLFHIRNTWGPETLLRPDRDGSTIVPNVAKSWTASADGMSWTFSLRKGMKWSDGAPFNADGFEFWYKDIVMDNEITPSKAIWMKMGGKMMEFEKVDNETFRLKFGAPNPLLVYRFAHYDGFMIVAQSAKHYMSKFHKNYVDKAALDKAAADAKFDAWWKYFNDKCAINNGMTVKNPDMPTIAPFYLKEKTTSARILSRNPYYWKVDTAGNQLPYIDTVNAAFVDKGEVANAMVASGKINFQTGFVFTLANYPLYKTNEAKGKYKVYLFKLPDSTAACFQPNQTCKDEALRKIYADLRFRKAVSYAIDRKNMNETLFQGLGVPVNTHVIENSKFYNKAQEEAHIKFDLAESNKLLDEMGLDKRDAEKWRLRPDGKRLIINLTYYASKDYMNGVAELFKEYMSKVGLFVKIESITGELMQSRVPANDVEFGFWYADKSSDIIFQLQPQWYVANDIGWERPWGVEWARWHMTGGKEGQMPPQIVQDVYKWWVDLSTNMDEAKRLELGKKILQAQADNLWTIGTVGHLSEPIIVGDNIKNWPKEGYTGYDYLTASIYRFEQVYFEGGKWSGEV